MWSDDDEYFSYSPYYFGSNDDDDDSGDDHYFDDDYYYSSGEDCSGLVLARNRARSKDNDSEASVEVASTPSYKVAPLQDLCCRFIARRFPFAFIEHRSPPIPDELQLKIIQFSFPDDEKMIQKYAEFSRSTVDYCSAKRMLENGHVKDMNQIGFRLSASVEDRIRCSSRSTDSGKYYVTIHFDRGKITSAHCSCELSTNWCSHVVATCLARIKNKDTVALHLPVSDSLNLLDREQLLKFAQYLLCEHQNEPVVETAQQLLDKLLSRQQQDKQEDINMIAGAPDPTAGPGLDEEAHWFVSKSGFKSRCDSLMYESQADLGFVMYNAMDNDRGNSVNELWERNILQQALVRDEMDLKLDNEYHGYSTRHQSVLHVLETIADLLQDDFMSAVSALTMCTEQLIERLNKLCRVNSPTDRYRFVHRVTRTEPKEAIVLCGSLAGGFTPRVSSCRTLSDELSRLWRLAVLRPGIPNKQHQGVIDQLRTLNQTVSVAFVTGTLRPWQGLEVAIRLSSINWNADDFQKVLKGDWVRLPVVSSCATIQLTCQSKAQYVSNWMAVEERGRNGDAFQAQNGSTVTLTFNNPHCISFGQHFDTDIHSVCSMIEALNVSSDYLRAMRLTVALSCALVSFYKNILLGVCDATSMPVSARCSLGAVHKIGTKPGGSGESPMEVETPHEKANNGHVWPEDTILSVTTFAFLFELLSQKADWAESCLVEMRSKLSPAETIHDCVKSVNSLKFHVGVLGLFLQRLPAPSLHHEVEEYNYECWLTYQLICNSPIDTDLAFLTHLGQHILSTRPFPPSSLSRVIFHHLFKGAPAALSKCLTERQSVGLGVAFHVLGHVNGYTIKESSSSWMLFQYATCRLWAKLAEVVLRSLSDSQELLERAMNCILQPNGMLGAQSLQDLSIDSTPVIVLSRLRDVEFITAKCRVACCLAKSLSEKQGNSIKVMQYKKESGNRVTRRESFEMEMPRKIMKSGVEKALKLCAVQIAAHSLWLQKLADRNRAHNETVRWLTDFVVSSGLDTVKCLVNCKGDVTSFFAQSELLDLCEKVLRKEKQVASFLGQDIVQGILLSLLQKASQSETSDDMKKIVSFCRDKRCATKLDLLPWICKGLQSLADSNAFLPFEVLMDASHGMLEHYKEKLAEGFNRYIMWNQKGELYLNRLFKEGVHADDDSDNEDGDSVSANRNPYSASEPHPFLETAFDLGMMGLEKLKDKSDEILNGKYPYYRRCPVKEHLSEFCRLVCYLVNKKWLTDASSGSPGSPIEVKSPKKIEEIPATVNATPGCSHWEDAQSQNDSLMSVDSCYLHKFVCSLISSVENPLWLFEVLQELGDHLCTEVIRSSPTSRQERQDLKIKEACQSYPSVKLLLQRDLDEFSKLLLGPEMQGIIEEVVHRRDRRRLEPSEIMYEVGHCQLMNTRLKDVLKTAKRAFSISDSSGSLFKHLTDEITSQHSILHSLVDGVLKEKELSSSDERELGIFPRASILPALFAQGLFPGLFERSYVDDYF